MGRFIASECGYYCTEVVDRKCNNGSEYAIVDGGIHQINYYGQARVSLTGEKSKPTKLKRSILN